MTGATFTVDIPEGFNLEQLLSTKGVCDIKLAQCELGDISPGETVTVVLDAIASDMDGEFDVSFMVATASGQTFNGSATVRVETDGTNAEGSNDGNGGCSVAGPSTNKESLAGLLLYTLLPASVFIRRRLCRKKIRFLSGSKAL